MSGLRKQLRDMRRDCGVLRSLRSEDRGVTQALVDISGRVDIGVDVVDVVLRGTGALVVWVAVDGFWHTVCYERPNTPDTMTLEEVAQWLYPVLLLNGRIAPGGE